MKSTYRQKGSALLVTLVMGGLIAFAVGLMLMHVTQQVRSTQDRMGFEEAWHTGLAGINAIKAYIVTQDKSTTVARQLGGTVQYDPPVLSGLAGDLARVTSGAIEQANYVAENESNPSLFVNMKAADIFNKWYKIQGLTVPSDGTINENGLQRQVLFQTYVTSSERPSNGQTVIALPNDLSGSAAEQIFQNATPANARSFVTRIRVTTPYRPGGTSTGVVGKPDDLTQTTLIVEAEGIALPSNKNLDMAFAGMGGGAKRRILAEKIQVLAQDLNTTTIPTPPLKPGAAIIARGTVTHIGESHFNVAWGPVWSKGAIKLLKFQPSYFKGVFSMSPQKVKSAGAGIDGDKWLKYVSAGLLTNDGSPLFTGLSPTTQDLFVEAYQGLLKDAGGKSIPKENVDLQPGYDNNYNGVTGGVPDWALPDPKGLNVFVADPDNAGNIAIGTGALVQNWPGVNALIDAQTNQLQTSETFFRNLAKLNGTYFSYDTATGKYSGSGLFGASWDDVLAKIDKTSLLGGQTNPYVVPDGVLFVESNATGAVSTYPTINVNSGSALFWRGLMYLKNMNINSTGAGKLADVHMQNPDQFAADPDSAGHLGSQGTNVSNCFLDGILFTNGMAGGTGNISIYGCVITIGGWENGGTPSIYYNPRLKKGMFFTETVTSGKKAITNILSSALFERHSWM